MLPIVTAGYSSAIDERLNDVSMMKRAIAREGIANALELSRTAGTQAAQIVQAAKESFIIGWQQAMWVGALLFIALFVYILARGPKETIGIEVVEKNLIPTEDSAAAQNLLEGTDQVFPISQTHPGQPPDKLN